MRPLLCNGKTLPRKSYLTQHLGRFLPVMAKALKPQGKADLEHLFLWAGVAIPKRYQRAARPLIWAAGRNPHRNQYHHDWHNATVMVFAAILAELAALSRPQRFDVMLAAMVHDLDHRGRFMAGTAFQEEDRSAMIAGRRLYGRSGSDGKSWRQLKTMIRQTSFQVANVNAGANPLAALLKDADLLASIVFPHADVLAMTSGLKREQNIDLSSEEMLYQFLDRMAERGLSSPAGRQLLKAAPMSSAALSSAAFRHYPDVAQRLMALAEAQDQQRHPS